LGPEHRGDLALVLAVILIACEVVSMGTISAVTYLIPLRGANGRRLMREQARWFVSTVATATATACLVVAVHVRGEPDRVVLTLSVGAATASYLTMRYVLAWVQGERWFAVLNVARPIPPVIYAVAALALYLAASERGLSLFLAAQALGNVTCIAYVIVATRASGSHGDAEVRRSALIGFGVRSLLGTSTPLDSLSIDQVSAGARLGSESLGYYAIGGSFANLTTFILQSMGFVAGPRLAAERDTAGRARLVRQWVGRAIAIGVTVVVSVELVLAPGIRILFGPEFEQSIPIARVLVAAGMLLAMRKFLGAILLGVGSSSGPAWGEAAALAGFGIGFAVLVGPFGIVGVAWSMGIAGAVSCCVMGELLRRCLRPLETEVT
jgi:O-antigen/teichoic acid export membrane protein